MYDTIEAQAHHRIQERVSRAAEPRAQHTRPRHRLAERLRRFADRIDS
jgi:hypothetical protein